MSKKAVCPRCGQEGTQEIYSSHGYYYKRFNHWDAEAEESHRCHIPTMRVSE